MKRLTTYLIFSDRQHFVFAILAQLKQLNEKKAVLIYVSVTLKDTSCQGQQK